MTVTSLHIEPTNICTLRCMDCARTKFIDQWPQRWKNHSLDIDALMRFIDIDISGMHLLLCGNYGDPIYHPRFHDLIREIKSRLASVTIVTNGSYRTQEWWRELCAMLTHKDHVEFSVDGTPDNFTQYRENADWASIRQGMEICVASPAYTRWKYIPFSFNEDTIDQARELAEEIGINRFYINTSARFDRSRHLMPTRSNLIAPEHGVRKIVVMEKDRSVDPQCATGQQHFITATGHYVPCCMISGHEWLYKTPFGRDRDRFDIHKTTLSHLLQDEKVRTFYQNIEHDPNLACQFTCPKLD